METPQITVNYVYDLAYDIAQEFEKIVHVYGIDKVKPLIDKIINTLEILESSIKRIEQLEAELGDVKSNNVHLSSEKIVNDHERAKLKQTFEETEEFWLQEIITLKSQISALKSKNELLKCHLSIKDESSSKLEDASKSVIGDQENVIHKLKYSLKQKEKQLQDNICNIHTLNSRIQELLELNKILHLKHQKIKNDISELIIEKNEYKSMLILQKKENQLLNESLNELVHSSLNKQKDSQKPSLCPCSEHVYENPSASINSSICYSKKEMELMEKIKKLQVELHIMKSHSQQYEEKLSVPSSKRSVSKMIIHQFFHLFLGIPTLSRMCWF